MHVVARTEIRAVIATKMIAVEKPGEIRSARQSQRACLENANVPNFLKLARRFISVTPYRGRFAKATGEKRKSTIKRHSPARESLLPLADSCGARKQARTTDFPLRVRELAAADGHDVKHNRPNLCARAAILRATRARRKCGRLRVAQRAAFSAASSATLGAKAGYATKCYN